MAPKRIQRKRTKGWKMPPNTVYVGRPTIWGNPFTPNSSALRDVNDCIDEYRANFHKHRGSWLYGIPGLDVDELRGKNLACWCRLDQPCHADVLLEIANSGAAGGNRQEPQK